jgi:hypothetical protein
MWLNPNHPSMGHLVACNYPKCNHKCSYKLGFHIILRIIHDNGWKLWHNRKVGDHTFNFMAMSCLLQLTILWHLSKRTRLFLVTCVHYNYKWIANSIIDFQFSSSDPLFLVRWIKLLIKQLNNAFCGLCL